MAQRYEFSGFLEITDEGMKTVGINGVALVPGLSDGAPPALKQLPPAMSCQVVCDVLATLLASAYQQAEPAPKILAPAGPIPNLRVAD